MLTIAIVCGAGIATSALLATRVRDHVAPRGSHLRVVQATVMDLLSPDFDADLVVSTVDLPDALGIPRVSGMPLLLGTRPEQTLQDIDDLLDRIDPTGPAGDGQSPSGQNASDQNASGQTTPDQNTSGQSTPPEQA